MKKLFVALSVLLLTSACSIKQRVDPVHVNNNAEVCIQKNPDVRDGFLQEMEKILAEKQIKYRIIEELDASQQCEWTATYTANWRWDLALYMVYAEIKVFHQGRLDGEAIYDARSGGANMNKFIDSEPKIRELIEKLIQQKQASMRWSPLQQTAI
ncbi:Sbal_3080 family lipoprotein [Shewanella sp. Isolate13]|uniref:Sbal_3080 family lipoprotein n=1 Tax=Shewanella sp. Isolate13 TaxID=2908531 RepID=UPI001EFEBB56|nr:Sbal_3080 family lipoprotein [Shewanella sp. Isolate13]MCG9731663.1 Sbal_3080 family lipoprotein [Shewanella sp. Isolate13]